MVHVRGVPVWPPQAAEPDEMSVSDCPMIVLPPCAYTLKSMPFVDGETNFGRRTPLDEPRPAVVPPMITETLTDSSAPGDFAGVPGGVVSAPPLPPPHPPKKAAATAAANNLRNKLIPSSHQVKSDEAPAPFGVQPQERRAPKARLSC